MSERIHLLQLPRLPYETVHTLQLELVSLRQHQIVQDLLILVEHDPVITLGRRADPSHILASPQELQKAGIRVVQTERGGDVTYHGPGQLVGYPILRLASYRLGVSELMHKIEQVLILALADLGIIAARREGYIGVWVGVNKIAALGVRIRRGVTFHGFALNVDPDMNHWKTIIPCGITDGWVTSIALERSPLPPIERIRERVATRFGEVFQRAITPIRLRDLPLSPGLVERLEQPFSGQLRKDDAGLMQPRYTQ